ncbi:uncharacterized protein MONOS_10258 [Monocercomonoides exilis]|uniref:uncharacterized protein n=1 Tax=Monocercomonoides exilis TaxID=2049356 RepID=UPI0035596197|nr:hypothetical protein MONOS_10258 [Monocercomonoides exilis]|eukprot:MONOS_10258.1-p1 / transcript=MONOS_10258.1 / gene=MONOS_10258 / organism=Monocercomonoides_exilis_PA203 / gene_product=unspecified product / transcript_product=unspecified product / location=Mono_scaffold00459:11324-11891(-) / protein_length=156 / sequence_SO=supercontig / SO=protein_coding / is_pseudo=false
MEMKKASNTGHWWSQRWKWQFVLLGAESEKNEREEEEAEKEAERKEVMYIPVYSFPMRRHTDSTVTSIGWCLKGMGSCHIPSDDSTAAAEAAADCAWCSCKALSAGATGQASPARCSPPLPRYLLSGWPRAADHCPRSCRGMEHWAVCWQHSHFV